MKNTFLIILLIMLPFLIVAQENLTGKVMNTKNEPVSFANILLLNPIDSTLIQGVVTNYDGEFEINNVKVQKALLTISMIGYQTHYQLLSIRKNEINTIPIIQLIEDVAILEGVEVVAKKPLFVQEIDRTVINVQNAVTSAGGNALEILSKSPGVQIDPVNNTISISGKQGVIVMINGKRSQMDAQALMQLLAGLPANNIEKIEIITTPPANFDAEGNAGIINIVLLKNMDDGLNGNIGGNFGYGVRPKFGGNMNFNYRKGKVNLFGDYSYNRELVQAFTYFGNTIVANNETVITDGISNRPATQTFNNARLGLDYQLSDKTIVGVLFSGYTTLWELDAQTDITTTSNLNPTFYQDLRSVEVNKWTHGMSNFSLMHKLSEGEKINFNYDYLYYFDNNPTDYLEQTYDENYQLIAEEVYQSRKETPINIQVVNVDYSNKINDKLTFEMGLKGTFTHFINDISVADEVGEELIYNQQYTNIFDLTEKIGAAYLSGNFQLDDKTTIKTGLRYEYFTTKLHTETIENLVNRQSGNLFPSIYLSRNINDENLVQVAYSRRIQRPSYTQLAPALFFFGPNTILVGNPAVQRVISDNLKLSYQRKAYNFSLSYSYEDAPIAFNPLILETEKQVVLQAENMKSIQSITANANLPFELKNWWNFRLNIDGIFANHQLVVADKTVQFNNFRYVINANQNFNLPKDFNVELGAYYQSKLKYGLNEVPTIWRLNLGVQKSFGDLKLSLNWNDIFNTGSFFEANINYPELNRVTRFHYDLEGSIVRLNLTYRFGNKDLKSARNRKTGSEEERGRVQ